MPSLMRFLALIALGCAIAPPMSLSIPPALTFPSNDAADLKVAAPASKAAVTSSFVDAGAAPGETGGAEQASTKVLHEVEAMIPKLNEKKAEINEEFGDLTSNQKVLGYMIDQVSKDNTKSRELVNTLQRVYVGLGKRGEALEKEQASTGAIIQTADKEAEELGSNAEAENRELQATDDSRALLTVELDSLTGAISRKINVGDIHASTLGVWASQLRDSVNVATKTMGELQAELLLVDDQMGTMAKQLIQLYSDVIKAEHPPGSTGPGPENPLVFR